VGIHNMKYMFVAYISLAQTLLKYKVETHSILCCYHCEREREREEEEEELHIWCIFLPFSVLD